MSISANKTQFIIKVSGNSEPEAYYLFDTQNRKLRWLTKGYSSLASEDLGEVIAFRYPARDGLKIPAVLTWPSDKKTAEQRKNLPLIVLPHGGPDAYDAIGFDWLAQFLANKGYLVLQPNFRGSTGFGGDFHRAGIGAWGREMQNDISDGVNYLTSKGIAAPKRTCIVGASYGGYAALAGAALTPELYRCVIAINGISDVRQHINRSIRNNAEPELVRRQWEGVFGDDKNAFKRLDEVSAYFFADRFNAATLLIYSKDDSIVSPRQSTKMHKALKKAGVVSTLIGLKGEDHWLSTSGMRHQLLSVLGSFLDEHNPAP